MTDPTTSPASLPDTGMPELLTRAERVLAALSKLTVAGKSMTSIDTTLGAAVRDLVIAIDTDRTALASLAKETARADALRTERDLEARRAEGLNAHLRAYEAKARDGRDVGPITSEVVDRVWRAVTRARPAGASDGDTYIVSVPTREDVRHALETEAALATQHAAGPVLVTEEADTEQLRCGARAIGRTIDKQDHIQRAREVWRAMHARDPGDIPSSTATPPPSPATERSAS